MLSIGSGCVLTRTAEIFELATKDEHAIFCLKTGKMMKATIIAIGKCKKNSPEKQLIDEYIKRSGWEVTIKEHDNASQEEEAKFLLSSVPAGAKAVVLDERGENMKSLELAAKAEKWMLDGCSEICFLIGGADGHLPSTRAVLAEQIYRIQTIISHHPYHRE